MRLPRSKVYRAFPELDRFSDEACARFVDAARRRHRAHEPLVAIAALASVVAVFVAWIWIVATLSRGLRIVLRLGPTDADVWIGALILGGGGISAAVLGLLIRDRWLRWAIRRTIVAAQCPKCFYSLLGLPIHAGTVSCPECGTTRTLAEVGLAADGLITVPEAAHPTSANPSDSP